MKNNYCYIWSENRSLINVESHIRQYIEQRRIFGSTHLYSFIFSKNGFAEELHREQDNIKWKKLGKRLLDKKFVDKLIEEGRDLTKHFQKYIEVINKNNLTTYNDEKIKQLFIDSYKFHSQFRAYFKTSREEFLELAEKEIKLRISDKFTNQSDHASIFEILTSPHAMDKVNFEQIDWQKLLRKSERSIKDAVLINHINKYPWLVAHSHDLTQIISHIKARIRNDLKNIKQVNLKVQELKFRKRYLKNKQVKLLSVANSQKLSYLSWLFQVMSLERMRLKGSWSGSDFLYLPLYKEISRRTNIILKDLYSIYRIDEVLKAVDLKKDIVATEEKKRRNEYYILWLKKGKLLFYSGQTALRKIDEQVEKASTLKELKGQTASKGHVTGEARIIIPGSITLLNLALKSFKSGEVLITTMTQPNMVPIMAKAKAIVTDEGGLTSHAAIIARELKLPCVVGTKFATKIIKDGDLIEVDASKGIVKIVGDNH